MNDGDRPFTPIRYSLLIHRHAQVHVDYGDTAPVKKPIRFPEQSRKIPLLTNAELAECRRKADARDSALWEWDRRFRGVRLGPSEVA